MQYVTKRLVIVAIAAVCGWANLSSSAVAGGCCGYRTIYETVYEDREICCSKTICETRYREECRTICRPIVHTTYTEERCCVTRSIMETVTRQCCYTVMTPVYETVMQQKSFVTYRQVVTMKCIPVDLGHCETRCDVCPGPCEDGCTKCRQVWVPNLVCKQVPSCLLVPEIKCRAVPVQVCRYVPKKVMRTVSHQVCRGCETVEVVKQVPHTCCEYVHEEVREQVPYVVTRCVPHKVTVRIAKYVPRIVACELPKCE